MTNTEQLLAQRNAELENELTALKQEIEIEAALEDVRSRSLAMHQTSELQEVVAVVLEKLQQLGFVMDGTATIAIYEKEGSKDRIHWSAAPDLFSSPLSFRFSYFDHIIESDFWNARQSGLDFFAKAYYGEDKNAYLKYVFENTDYKQLPDELKNAVLARESYACSFAFAKHSGIFIDNLSGRLLSENEANILKRFARVFEQAYVRFLDLKKAEALAREARIEAGLERVRSRTLAMQKSDELADTAAVLFKQLINLGIEPNRLFIGIIKDETGDKVELWATEEDGSKISRRFTGNTNGNESAKKMYVAWKEKKKTFTLDMQGKELADYFYYLSEELKVPFKLGQIPKRRVQNIAYFSKGFIGMASPDTQTEEAISLLEKFAAVFNLTYARFNDLQQAEAQGYKARIETALERVRARALTMQQPEELMEVARVLWHEMGLLGIEELETCSIYIHNKNSNKAECWYAIKNAREGENKLISDHFILNLNATWAGRQMLRFYKSEEERISIVMQGENRKEWIDYCKNISAQLREYYDEAIPDRTCQLHKFSHGAIGADTAGDISDESWSLLKRAASVFSLAYSRFKDLSQGRIDLQKLKEEKKRAEEALTELQITQRQLIQSEKMASLGELTAGIAHEIQNPLNFVNNFSEVSKELLAEMKTELDNGSIIYAKEIAVDVIQNLEKINYHGKRAEAIVKGMLQHSRKNTGQKEPTDLNALCDEFLRLSYHGLRAKDKNFNADYKMEFDETMGKINMIPQDIGRVLLNLFNNAFYAVNERKKVSPQPLKGSEYKPLVSVTTRKRNSPSGVGGTIEIVVKDNGNGIPQNIADKIFQPFFTTKPSGDGTGLGLSLSYDIVAKEHNGTLKVESKEGEGTAFLVELPIT